MSFTPNLPAYFRRIGYTGATDPTLDTLRNIIRCHTATIPFENLDVLLGKSISLEPAALEQKLVHDHRGGYCFEQNGWLLQVLLAMGYQATPLSARVRLKAPRDFTPPRTHLFIRVELNGVPWLCDVGVGRLSPTTTLRLDLDSEQSTPHEPRRIIHEVGRYFHQAKLDNQWADVCEFTMEQMPQIDRDLANYWTSTNPMSKFRQNLFAARAAENGTRYSIYNSEFTHRKGAEILTRRDLKSPADLLAHLSEFFHLQFPAETRFPIPSSL